MKGELLIEIIQKREEQKITEIFDKIEQNFRSCYTISSERMMNQSKPTLKIRFLELEEITRRTKGMIEMCNYFLRAFANSGDIDRFQYFQRVLKKRASTKSNLDTYLILHYKTNLLNEFRDYFRILNQFFTILDMLCFIEEVKDGFVLFFERSIDFEDFLDNVTSKQSLLNIMKKKDLLLPDQFFQKVVNVVQKKLTIAE